MIALNPGQGVWVFIGVFLQPFNERLAVAAPPLGLISKATPWQCILIKQRIEPGA
jgi:hypothetical protein